MPALFAYLIAIGLLLGGGYGALSWLAAPEPVKVAAKAKPTPRRHFDEASPEAASKPNEAHEAQKTHKAGPASISQSEQAAAVSNQQPAAPLPEAGAASREQGAQAEVQAEVSVPAQVQQDPAIRAEVSPAEVRPPVQDVQPAQAASPGTQKTAVSTVPATAGKTVKRPHQRLASRSEKPALALMTLRTIEFPDGRRVTQLIPYRNGERAPAFQPDE
jgi:hypothetical protein